MKSSWDAFVPVNGEKYEPVRQFPYAESADPDQTLYLSVPKGKRNVPLLIFFHGGGMTHGAREVPDMVFHGEFASAEPRYRLSPVALAPAQIEDAAQAIAWCFAHADEFSIDRRRIFVGGMSAGA